jgi:hypothetical protein
MKRDAVAKRRNHWVGLGGEERDYTAREALELARGARDYGSGSARRKEADMSSSSRCPSCGAKIPGYVPDAEDDGDDDATEKRHGLDVVSKGARMSVDSLVDDFRKALPAASEAEVAKRASDSPLMNDLVVAERTARLRAQGY